mmetsp:Transcript_10355/g.27133  ORF Transcript_10355/g.27133 Transcript_10355/m.27133 type:complete len:143 (-) Transcript_10355:920-1348(-)
MSTNTASAKRLEEDFLDFEDEEDNVELVAAPSSPSNIGDEESQENEGQKGKTVLEKSKHPAVLVFHYVFKLAAIVAYLFASLLGPNFVVMFVVVVILLAADFWMVKNISGRLLVGLRWWNEVKEDGKSEWRFEARKVRKMKE